jgi:hypothetical protein
VSPETTSKKSTCAPPGTSRFRRGHDRRSGVRRGRHCRLPVPPGYQAAAHQAGLQGRDHRPRDHPALVVSAPRRADRRPDRQRPRGGGHRPAQRRGGRSHLDAHADRAHAQRRAALVLPLRRSGALLGRQSRARRGHPWRGRLRDPAEPRFGLVVGEQPPDGRAAGVGSRRCGHVAQPRPRRDAGRLDAV